METPSIRVLPCWGILKYNKFNSIQYIQRKYAQTQTRTYTHTNTEGHTHTQKNNNACIGTYQRQKHTPTYRFSFTSKLPLFLFHTHPVFSFLQDRSRNLVRRHLRQAFCSERNKMTVKVYVCVNGTPKGNIYYRAFWGSKFYGGLRTKKGRLYLPAWS